MSNSKAKVLLFDIEVTPNVVYSWAVGPKISLSPGNIAKEREIICISYKWLHEKKAHTLRWNTSRKKDKDRELVKKFRDVYNSADSVVAHNGRQFDIKWINTRLLYHRVGPLAPVHVCDTLTEARRAFRFNSNKLDYIAKYVGSQGKDAMSMDDWIGVMEGSNQSLNKMCKYCERDIYEMESVYKILQPYIKTLSPQAVTGDRGLCTSCGSESVQKYGFYYTASGKYQKYKCNSCGHVFKDRGQLKA